MTKQGPSSKGKLIVVVFLMAGIISTFAYKLQGSQLVNEGDHTKKHFFHPYIQSMTMFIGEMLCLFAYLSLGDKAKLQLEEGKTPHKKWVFAIPALSDALSSMLQYMGLAFISGSTYMMFKGASIVTTAIFSRILVGMVIEKRHITGCGLAILGLVIVGSSGFFSKSDGESTFSKQFPGYVLMLISLIFNGFLYAYEQKLMKKHTIHPLQMVGFEGCFGIIYLTIIITILSFIPCNFAASSCVFDNDDHPFFELPKVYFRQIGNNGFLLALVIVGIASISIFNFGGVTITKMFDALTRSLLNVTKTAAIWAVGIMITLFATSKQYQLQSLSIVVNLIKAVGFTSIIFGTLIYNQLIFKEYFAAPRKPHSLISQEDIHSDLYKSNESQETTNK